MIDSSRLAAAGTRALCETMRRVARPFTSSSAFSTLCTYAFVITFGTA
ncbi:MAG: hypothetical protein ACYDH5_20085 [Acidimicrobiales bacterium]